MSRRPSGQKYSIWKSGNWTRPSAKGRSWSSAHRRTSSRSLPGRPSLSPTAPVRLLEEHLIVAPEVLLEDHALDVRAFVQPAAPPTRQIGSIELRVVNELSLPGEPVVKRLRRLMVGAPM